MGTFSSSLYPLYFAGSYGAITSMTVLANFNGISGSALDSWYSNNATVANGTFTNNCVASTTYSAAGNSTTYTRNWYATGKSMSSISPSSGSNKNITSTNNFIGTGQFNAGLYDYYFYIGHLGFFYWAPISLTDSDRNKLEATTVFY